MMIKNVEMTVMMEVVVDPPPDGGHGGGRTSRTTGPTRSRSSYRAGGELAACMKPCDQPQWLNL